jgi:hypothetical protein
MKKSLSPIGLRTIGFLVIFAGAAGSLDLVLHAGRNNGSVVLKVLFAIWVLSPFIALIVANSVSWSWQTLKRDTLFVLILILSVGSVIVYSGVLSPASIKPAFVFLVVPLISWMLLAIALPFAATVSRRQSRRKDML